MAGLYHDFYLINRSKHDIHDYGLFLPQRSDVELHDDLIHYMIDSLNWIPTYNPARKEPHNGLCLYGPTVIQTEGATIAGKIFQAYIDLFRNGPEILKLKGYSVTNEKGEEHYEWLTYPRAEILNDLRKLVHYSNQVVESEGALYILHIGV